MRRFSLAAMGWVYSLTPSQQEPAREAAKSSKEPAPEAPGRRRLLEADQVSATRESNFGRGPRSPPRTRRIEVYQDGTSNLGNALARRCQCGAEYARDALFCETCGNGRPVETPSALCEVPESQSPSGDSDDGMEQKHLVAHCPRCGSTYSANALFCERCGDGRPEVDETPQILNLLSGQSQEQSPDTSDVDDRCSVDHHSTEAIQEDDMTDVRRQELVTHCQRCKNIIAGSASFCEVCGDGRPVVEETPRLLHLCGTSPSSHPSQRSEEPDGSEATDGLDEEACEKELASHCPKCNASFAANAVFCEACGNGRPEVDQTPRMLNLCWEDQCSDVCGGGIDDESQDRKRADASVRTSEQHSQEHGEDMDSDRDMHSDAEAPEFDAKKGVDHDAEGESVTRAAIQQVVHTDDEAQARDREDQRTEASRQMNVQQQVDHQHTERQEVTRVLGPAIAADQRAGEKYKAHKTRAKEDHRKLMKENEEENRRCAAKDVRAAASKVQSQPRRLKRVELEQRNGTKQQEEKNIQNLQKESVSSDPFADVTLKTNKAAKGKRQKQTKADEKHRCAKTEAMAAVAQVLQWKGGDKQKGEEPQQQNEEKTTHEEVPKVAPVVAEPDPATEVDTLESLRVDVPEAAEAQSIHKVVVDEVEQQHATQNEARQNVDHDEEEVEPLHVAHVESPPVAVPEASVEQKTWEAAVIDVRQEASKKAKLRNKLHGEEGDREGEGDACEESYHVAQAASPPVAAQWTAGEHKTHAAEFQHSGRPPVETRYMRAKAHDDKHHAHDRAVALPEAAGEHDTCKTAVGELKKRNVRKKHVKRKVDDDDSDEKDGLSHEVRAQSPLAAETRAATNHDIHETETEKVEKQQTREATCAEVGKQQTYDSAMEKVGNQQARKKQRKQKLHDDEEVVGKQEQEEDDAMLHAMPAAAETVAEHQTQTTQADLMQHGTSVMGAHNEEQEEEQEDVQIQSNNPQEQSQQPHWKQRKNQKPVCQLDGDCQDLHATQVVAKDGSEVIANFSHEVFRVFASFEEGGAVDPTGALARLRALRRTQNDARGSFTAALELCAEAVLGSGECRSTANVVDACLDLLAAAAAETEAEEGSQGELLSWLAQRAPNLRDRAARCRASGLLWRLLPSCQDDRPRAGAVQEAEKVLLDLSKDRAPAVRLASVRGLSCLRGEACQSALLVLACKDPIPAVRAAALSGLGAMGAAAQASSRCLDASVKVRCRFFAALAMTPSQEIPADLIRRGLRDTSVEVRSMCERLISVLMSKRGREEGREQALLHLTEVLSEGHLHSDVAEAAIKALALEEEWAKCLQSISAKAFQHQELGVQDRAATARALLWRVATNLSDEFAASTQELQPDTLSLPAQALAALRHGQLTELKQLLRALLSTEGGASSQLLEVAKAVMLEVPPDDELSHLHDAGGRLSSRSMSSHVGLAVALVRKVHGCQGGAAPMEAEAQVNQTIASVLEELWQGAQSGEGLEALGSRFDHLLQEQASMTSLASISDELCTGTLRALHVIDSSLCQSSGHEGATGAGIAPSNSEDFLERWLCPALKRADAAEPVLGGGAWAVQRALCIRCMALCTSKDPEAAAAHWPFFTSVLERFAPLVTSMGDSSSRSAHAAEVVTETCAVFLSDVLLVHGGPCGWLPNIAQHACELFSALLKALGHPAIAGANRPAKLRRHLSDRLITLLLYGVAWAGQDVCPGSDCRPHPGASWALAWLMLEAFYGAPPGPSASAFAEPARLASEPEEAAYRGRLLCFFGCLGRASAPHASLLASAGEILLSTDLWRLGAQRPLLSDHAVSASTAGLRRWRCLQLPRLLRLLCQQLAASAASSGSAAAARELAELWFRSVWRPLALLCLEAFDEESLLAELIQASLAPVEAVDSSGAVPLSAAGEAWPCIAQEVVASCQEIGFVWRKRQSFDADNTITSGGCVGQTLLLVPTVRRLAARLRCAAKPSKVDDAEDEDEKEDGGCQSWAKSLQAARAQRLCLQKVLKELGVDCKALVAGGVKSLKAYASRASVVPRRAGRQPGTTREASSRGPDTSRKAGLRGPGSRKRLAKAISDDDSEGAGRSRPSQQLMLGRPGQRQSQKLGRPGGC
eukprot:TRINITY_DN61188_c0_g1_i1.p1 TRINITY_DN61188_c0_g1~~TRINITY_DN61188_c0_g1_i1.p1  ORF type:complete len:2103 (+),score=456.73 TRINITY_DN61188_c0_g1_i1:80-6388(+)